MPYKDSTKRYESQKRHRDRNHELMWELLVNSKCSDCNISDPRVLEFDHLPMYEKKFDIARAIAGSTRSWNSILTEIKKCDIVCSNCHKIRTMTRGNYKRHQSYSK